MEWTNDKNEDDQFQKEKDKINYSFLLEKPVYFAFKIKFKKIYINSSL